MSDERLLTAAQSRHLKRLYMAFEQAQKELNDFASYLLAEHGIEDPEQWQLSRDLEKLVPIEPGAQST